MHRLRNCMELFVGLDEVVVDFAHLGIFSWPRASPA
jgi:hypothetical protein